MKDHYFILGVAPTASSPEIKDAFRKLCLKYHPDRNADDPYNQERYMDICEAYRVLSNKSKRVAYDKKRPNDKTQVFKEELSKIKTGLYPEIKTSYKGLYPWLAAFAILIVASIALIFNFSTEQSIYAKKAEVSIPASKPIIADTIKQAPIATVKDTAATDSMETSDVLANFITSTLKENTIEENTGSADRDHQYSLKDNKLFIIYETSLKGQVTHKEVSIPIKDIESIYYRAGQLRIRNQKRSIRISDLNSGVQTRTDHFSVSFDTSRTADLEHKLVEAFTLLKTL